jgi:hypothetical protein
MYQRLLIVLAIVVGVPVAMGLLRTCAVEISEAYP